MLKKISFGLLVVLAMAGTLFAAPPDMVLKQFDKQMQERIAAQAKLAQTPVADGIHVYITGSGSPLNDANSSASGAVVNIGTKYFVIDAGDGSVRKLQTVGIPIARVEALLLTHFHSDHIAGLGELAMGRWTNSAATSPLPVYGPEGVSQVVEGYNMAYAQDNSYRIAHHGEDFVPASGKGSLAKEFKLGEDPKATAIIYEQDGIKITMFNVDHAPVKPAVGYKFEYKGRSLVFSGDTNVTEALELQSKDVDLLVQDVLSPEIVSIMAKNVPAPNLKKILSDIPSYHASPDSVGQMAQNAGVKNLVLTHMVPPMPDMLRNIVFKSEIEKSYKGNVILAKDGLKISLPADSDKFEVEELLK